MSINQILSGIFRPFILENYTIINEKLTFSAITLLNFDITAE